MLYGLQKPQSGWLSQLGSERERKEAEISRAIGEVIEKSLTSGSAKSL